MILWKDKLDKIPCNRNFVGRIFLELIKHSRNKLVLHVIVTLVEAYIERRYQWFPFERLGAVLTEVNARAGSSIRIIDKRVQSILVKFVCTLVVSLLFKMVPSLAYSDKVLIRIRTTKHDEDGLFAVTTGNHSICVIQHGIKCLDKLEIVDFTAVSTDPSTKRDDSSAVGASAQMRVVIPVFNFLRGSVASRRGLRQSNKGTLFSLGSCIDNAGRQVGN